jgi:hypothetical protein
MHVFFQCVAEAMAIDGRQKQHHYAYDPSVENAILASTPAGLLVEKFRQANRPVAFIVAVAVGSLFLLGASACGIFFRQIADMLPENLRPYTLYIVAGASCFGLAFVAIMIAAFVPRRR